MTLLPPGMKVHLALGRARVPTCFKVCRFLTTFGKMPQLSRSVG